MSLQRTIRRNMFKSAIGSNNIQYAWRQSRIRKYKGWKNWFFNYYKQSKKYSHCGYWGETGRSAVGRILGKLKKFVEG